MPRRATRQQQPDGHERRDHHTRHDRHDRRVARREELLDAALDAVRRHGAGVSMQELAAAAGVTKPILYRHFGDRDGLIAAIAERFAADLLQALRGALGSQADPKAMLTATVDAFVAFVEHDPDVYGLLVRQAQGSHVGGFLRQIGSEVAVVVGEQLRAEGSDSGPAEVLAHGMVGLVHAAGDWWVTHRSMPRQRLVTYVTDFLWGGLTSMGVRA